MPPPCVEPIHDRLLLLVVEHLAELVGVVQHQHAIRPQERRLQVLGRLGDIHHEAVLLAEPDEPPVGPGDLRVTVPTRPREDQHPGLGRCSWPRAGVRAGKRAKVSQATSRHTTKADFWLDFMGFPRVLDSSRNLRPVIVTTRSDQVKRRLGDKTGLPSRHRRGMLNNPERSRRDDRVGGEHHDAQPLQTADRPTTSPLAVPTGAGRDVRGSPGPGPGRGPGLSPGFREQMQPFVDKNEVAGVVTLVGSAEGSSASRRSAAGTSRTTCRCGPTRSSGSPR